jgi:hypothetical protein
MKTSEALGGNVTGDESPQSQYKLDIVAFKQAPRRVHARTNSLPSGGPNRRVVRRGIAAKQRTIRSANFAVYAATAASI